MQSDPGRVRYGYQREAAPVRLRVTSDCSNMKDPVSPNNSSIPKPGDAGPGQPDGGFVTRAVQVGGVSKKQLLAQLTKAGVELDEAARILFASDRFTTSATRQALAAVEATVRQLGFPNGATTQEVCDKAVELGLCLPPTELGPHMRLQCLDQPEGYWGFPVTEHRAPPGSLTVISAPLSEDHEFPKGFYLRRINGTLWLRGYWSGAEHRYDPEDRLVFCQTAGAGRR